MPEPINDKRIFIADGARKGGMDKDNEVRYIPNGFYLNARNVNFMQNGDRFVLSNVKGNTNINNNRPSGSNVCIGHFDDKNNNTAYFFNYNGNGNHEIVKYEYATTSQTTTQLCEGSGLAFDKDYLITGIVIVRDRFLIWTDNLNEIGCIDLDNLPTSTITDSNRWEIELAKANDLEPLNVMYVSDLNRDTNSLYQKQYQFRYRYIYEGNFRSAPSCISQTPVPDADFLIYSSNFDTNGYDNAINIDIPQPSYDKVEKVELFVREGKNDTTKDANLWYKFAEIPYGQLPNSYAFTGDEAYEPQDFTEFQTEITFFPKKCKEVVFLPSNVLAMLNITDGLDTINVEPECALFASDVSRPSSTPSSTTTATYSNANTSSIGTQYNPKFNIEQSVASYDTITITGTPQAGDTVRVTLNMYYQETSGNANPASISSSPSTTTGSVSAVYVIKTEDTYGSTTENREAVAAKVARAINSVDTRLDGFGGVVAMSEGAVVRLYQGTNQNNTPYVVNTTIRNTSTASVTQNWPDPTGSSVLDWSRQRTVKTFKKGAKHPFAIEYLDRKGRRSGAIPIGELFIEKDLGTPTGWTKVNIIIGHLAPEWATHYHILYAKNQTKELFLQAGVTATSLAGGEWSLDIYDRIDDFNDIFAGAGGTTGGFEYNYVEGDRVVLIGLDSGGLSTFSDYVDLPIIRDRAEGVVVDYNLAGLTPSVSTADDVYIEIYRPKQTSNRVYYEIGYVGSIDNNRRHSGNITNQSANAGANIELENFGDVFSIRRAGGSLFPSDDSFFESQDISSLYESKLTDIGRANYDTPTDEEVVLEAAITHTQPIISDTSSNGLSVILATSLNDNFGTDFGSIQKAFLRQDRQLVIFFENKVGYMGVFSELRKSANGDVIYSTDSLTNNINYYAYDGGIGTHPESFAYYDTTNYFFSPENNAVCRLGADGITEISRYGMTSWFNDNLDIKNNDISNLKVLGTYDERNNSYVISFRRELSFTINSFSSPDLNVTPTAATYGSDYIEVGDTLILVDNQATPVTYVQTVGAVTYNDPDFDVRWNGSPSGANVTSFSVLKFLGTLVFNEIANGWVGFMDFNPDYMGTAGIDFMSYNFGQGWVHNQNSTYGSFYGTINDAEVTIPFNAAPEIIKIFNNIQLNSNAAWSSDTEGDIYTEEGQSSQLATTDYENLLPNRYMSYLLKDENTPNVTHPLVRGDDLISHTLIVRLKSNSTSQVKLQSATVSSTAANLTI